MNLQGAFDECIFHRGARGYSVAYAKGGCLLLPDMQRFTADFFRGFESHRAQKAYRQEVLDLFH